VRTALKSISYMLFCFSLAVAAKSQDLPQAPAIEPQYINVFYAVDTSGKLVDLERTRAIIHTKGHALPGHASFKTLAQVDPGQSSVRLPTSARFIVRGRSPMDPESRYQLRLLKSSKDHREFVMTQAHASGFVFHGSGATSTLSEGDVPIQFEEYGRSSYRITPTQPLQPGEYALSIRGMSLQLYCFGVDP
jgi:hypothetical protein